MRLLFNKEDLKLIFAKHASETLKLPITPDEISDFDYPTDDEDEITGVSIEFEAPAP